jgi:prepilin-type N-terminal cleavage/methylation domain-containing protein
MNVCTQRRGFTVLELLIVIAIIGLLAGIVLAYMGPARDRAKATAILQQLQEIEKALRIYMISENKSTWPSSGINVNNQTDDCAIDNLVATGGIGCTPSLPFPNFSNYLSTSPNTTIANTEYGYWNEGNPYICGGAGNTTAHRTGIRIRLGRISGSAGDILTYFDYIDRAIDGGNETNRENCGRVGIGGSSNSLYYLIATDDDEI